MTRFMASDGLMPFLSRPLTFSMVIFNTWVFGSSAIRCFSRFSGCRIGGKRLSVLKDG